MKRKVLLLIAVVLLFAMALGPVVKAESAFNISDSGVGVRQIGGNYLFSKPIRRLNSYNGSTVSTSVYSGSCSGNNRQITSVKVYCHVSNGSDPFILRIVSPRGTVATRWCGNSTTTYDFSNFDGEDPRGNWLVSITTQGTITTMDGSLTVRYNYE